MWFPIHPIHIAVWQPGPRKKHQIIWDADLVQLLFEAALDASVFDKNMYAMLGCATGAKRNTPEAVAIINAKTYIRDIFIPSWINASNEPNDENGYFITEGLGLKKKLDEIGVPNDLVFFPGANLPHGYMDRMGQEPHAKEAFERMMAFINKYI